MRRKPGSLVPLEQAICVCAAELHRSGIGEFHGYELAKRLAEAEGRDSLAAFGTLYRALGRLQEMGLLKSRWEDARIAAADSRPARRLYALTTAGRISAQEVRNAELATAARRVRNGWSPV